MRAKVLCSRLRLLRTNIPSRPCSHTPPSHNHETTHPPKGPFKECWDCRALTQPTDNFCGNCRVIQPSPHSQSPFELFHIPPTFDVSLRLLDRQYKTLQTQLHPDKFACRPLPERELSNQRSAEVNEAFRVLSDPLERAKLLLGLSGEGDIMRDEPEFLMGIMDAREEAEECEGQELARLYRKHKEEMKELEQDLSRAFRDDKREEAKKLVSKGTYLKQLLNSIAFRLPVTSL